MVFLGCACNDRRLSSGVVAGLVVDVGARVPIRTDLLGVCRPGDHALWYYPWRSDGSETARKMPAIKWMGF